MMLGYHREPMEQDKYVRHIWNTRSRWGIRRRNRIILWSCCGVVAVVGIALTLLLR